MNEKQSNNPIQDSDAEDASLVDLLLVLATNKKLILGLPVVVGVITLCISFLLPPTYRASAVILPPQQAQSGAAALLAQLGGAASAVAGATGIKNPGDVYIGMLKSRTIADRVISRFDLKKVYDADTLEETRKKLELNTSVSAAKEGLITVLIEDGNKTRVAAIANAYIEELKNLTRVLAVTDAAIRRLFFERQLEQAKNNLSIAELALKQGFEIHGVISVDSDSHAIIETIAKLRAQVSAKEIQLNSMRSFVTVNNQDYKQAEQELSSLKIEMNRLENGQATPNAGIQKTQAGLENIKLLRDVKYNQMLYEVLAKQYEAARLEEARDASVIQILDPAMVPEKAYSPKHLRLAVIAAVIAFFAALLSAFMRNSMARMQQRPSFSRKWTDLRARLRFGK